MNRVLTINPGATSTKMAVFDDEKVVLKKTIEHQGPELGQYARIFDQYEYRLSLIEAALADAGIPLKSLSAVVGRGGLLKPLAGGTYAVNELLLADVEKAERGEHASNLGAVLAYNIAKHAGVPSFIVDPVSVDEMEPVARISGIPDMVRASFSHALNMKAVSRKVAAELGKPYNDLNLIVAHLGTGVSLSAHRNGRMVDIVDGKDEGPFAPDRCGGIPSSQLVKLCFSGKYTREELTKRLFGAGGFQAYLGTKDLRQIEKMAADGDATADLLLDAMAYQIAKAIGSLAAVLEGRVDRIILTGGMAHSKRLVGDISRRVAFIAPIALVPGEEELESLAAGALRVLRNEEAPKQYV